ncbi:type IV secretion system protein [Candidatus Williamhamiltonella defendens]|uniref:VirB6 conjugal transfer protein n=1 Tax=Hamiltonella defensa subsp. Acyrthosiphon pisum (strain 5AT) TaxID=572265 RepID=C4K3N9_HAMD5|nr:type IV secretion system protein [Candidatus Hamiltonella defensa]ACQ67182.1 VirB6 conjugal transfer protein [Candidatus Hamiltonella defensa 5AT (Acyrthosiphon pisum)]ATW21947.1 conjugal transfer protein [Candidatus Hamiltonella defensa]
MDVYIAKTLYQAIDEGLKGTIAIGTANVMTLTGVIFGTCWLIHLTLKSIYWLFQGLDVAFQDLLLTLGKASFIIYFAFNVRWYIDTVVPVVNGLPNWMAQTLSSSGLAQSNQVDTVISNFFTALNNTIGALEFSIWKEAAAMCLGFLALLFFLLGGIPFIMVVVGTLITLKAATSIILVVGPIFIAFSLFDQTRQWFWGWVSVIGGFMLTQILFGVVLAIELNFIHSVIIKNGKIETDILSCFALLLYFSAFTLLATELPNYAASIMGGTPSGGVSGVGGILGRGTGLRAAGNMSQAAGKGIMKGVNKLRNRNRIT